MPSMQPDPHALAQCISLAGLIAGTAEYSHLLRRRAARRRNDSEDGELEAAGLRALVRIEVAREEAAWLRRHRRRVGGAEDT